MEKPRFCPDSPFVDIDYKEGTFSFWSVERIAEYHKENNTYPSGTDLKFQAETERRNLIRQISMA